MKAFSTLESWGLDSPPPKDCYIKGLHKPFELVLSWLLNYLHIHWPVKVGLAPPSSLMEEGGATPPLCNQALFFNRIRLRLGLRLHIRLRLRFLRSALVMYRSCYFPFLFHFWALLSFIIFCCCSHFKYIIFVVSIFKLHFLVLLIKYNYLYINQCC